MKFLSQNCFAFSYVFFPMSMWVYGIVYGLKVGFKNRKRNKKHPLINETEWEFSRFKLFYFKFGEVQRLGRKL